MGRSAGFAIVTVCDRLGSNSEIFTSTFVLRQKCIFHPVCFSLICRKRVGECQSRINDKSVTCPYYFFAVTATTRGQIRRYSADITIELHSGASFYFHSIACNLRLFLRTLQNRRRMVEGGIRKYRLWRVRMDRSWKEDL